MLATLLVPKNSTIFTETLLKYLSCQHNFNLKNFIASLYIVNNFIREIPF